MSCSLVRHLQVTNADFNDMNMKFKKKHSPWTNKTKCNEKEVNLERNQNSEYFLVVFNEIHNGCVMADKEFRVYPL